MSSTTLLTSIVETVEPGNTPGITVTSFKMNGEPSARAIVHAVSDNYHRLLGRDMPTAEQLQERIGKKVTLVYGGENMLGADLIVAREGTLFAGSGGGVSILPKGARKKGYRVDPARVLDVLPGYDVAAAQSLIDEARGHYPQLQNLTQERLNALPPTTCDDDPPPCTLAVFGTYALPDSVASDALWLIGEYVPEDDICDGGVLLVRPEHGTSEHGSMYGQNLLRNSAVGEVVGFEPVSFHDAVGLCELDYDEAVAQALGIVIA